LPARGRDEKGGKKFDENGSLRKTIRRAEIFRSRMRKKSENHSWGIGGHG
jgi:hypothetical protein